MSCFFLHVATLCTERKPVICHKHLCSLISWCRLCLVESLNEKKFRFFTRPLTKRKFKFNLKKIDDSQLKFDYFVSNKGKQQKNQQRTLHKIFIGTNFKTHESLILRPIVVIDQKLISVVFVFYAWTGVFLVQR